MNIYSLIVFIAKENSQNQFYITVFYQRYSKVYLLSTETAPIDFNISFIQGF